MKTKQHNVITDTSPFDTERITCHECGVCLIRTFDDDATWSERAKGFVQKHSQAA